MTLRLILTRHAKSNWDDPAADDFARPLNDRGRQSARAIGHWLAQHGYVPDEVLSSDAERTRETWAEISPLLGAQPAVRWDRALYHADPQQLLKVLRGASSPVVLMLGHNPGIGAAASAFARKAPPHPRFNLYPTAATTIYDFAIDAWAQADWGAGTVVDFTVPRDLGVA